MPEAVVSRPTKPLWGLEGIHVWDDRLPINARDAWPRIKLTQITGLSSLGDADDARTAYVGRDGEMPRQSFRRGKTIAYEADVGAGGGIQARTLKKLREYEARIREAFWDLQEKRMTVLPHPSHDTGERFFYARVIDLEIPDVPATPFAVHHGHARSMALSVRLSDSRYYDGEEVVTAPIPPNESGTVSHLGTVPTDPILELHGPTTGGALVNQTLNNALLRIGAIATGDVLVIDFAKRTLTLNGTTNARSLLNLGASTWWDSGVWGLAPGDNVISTFLGGTNYIKSRLTVKHHAAFA
jgi:hypothetical protein